MPNKNASEVYALGGASRYTIRLSTDDIWGVGGMGGMSSMGFKDQVGGRSEKYMWSTLNLFCDEP
jgi:hypothetical protein